MNGYILGEISRSPAPLTAGELEGIIARAHAMKREVAAIPQAYLLDLLDRVGRVWSDPAYPYRREALTRLPDLIGFSPAMIEQGIGVMADLTRRENMLIRLACDLGDSRCLDDWVFDARFRGFIKAQPIGVVVHVSAGNVFVGGVDTLIQGIVTRNVNLMKMSSVDPVFPVLFARSLRDHDERGVTARSLALLSWKGGDREIEGVLKRECNAIVVYGGAEAVRGYREGLGLHTRLVEYGPKYSFVLVDRDELERRGLDACARLIARDAVMWEQSACSSPHVVYVEGRETAQKLMNALGAAFEQWAAEIPPGKLSDDEAVEITKVRELAKVEKAMGTGDLLHAAGTGWTLALRDDPEFETSCLNRTLIIKPVADLEAAVAAVAPMGEYIQTVAILADDRRAQRLALELSAIGADRMVEIGRMAARKHGTPHDGTRGLATLVRWTSLSRNALEHGVDAAPWQRVDDSGDTFDFLPDRERDAVTFARLGETVAYCRRHSPLLAERYKDLPATTPDEFKNLPLMTGEDYKRYLPPHGSGLLTTGFADGYVFSSGGTTGTPKAVYRTVQEQHYNAVRLGKGLALSVFGPGDVVANLLFAGNMWASFISYNQALEYTGCRILPISGNLPMEQMAGYLSTFGANAAITIPSVLLSLAAHVEQHRLPIRLRKVSTGGEHLFAGARDYLGRTLGVEQFASTGYTTNDTGAIGYQCPHCTGGVHHVHEDLHLLEILDPETNEPLGPGRIGKVVVTNLQRRLMPTIRYEVGDLGRWIDGECPCGRKTRLMELLGRSDDVLIIGGGNIHPEVVAAAVHATPGLSPHFQIIARLEEHRDQMLVRVERAADADPSADGERVEQLIRRLLAESKDLNAMIRGGLAAPAKVDILPPGGIERNSKTGKIRLTVDERH
ncbi:MAG: AMP-binding protein [Deltaproteobacteria bacterium]|nr:AMP-binding protein [Deltaproteobacteria bacterium]